MPDNGFFDSMIISLLDEKKSPKPSSSFASSKLPILILCLKLIPEALRVSNK
jgi:hypothetical protein